MPKFAVMRHEKGHIGLIGVGDSAVTEIEDALNRGYSLFSLVEAPTEELARAAADASAPMPAESILPVVFATKKGQFMQLLQRISLVAWFVLAGLYFFDAINLWLVLGLAVAFFGLSEIAGRHFKRQAALMIRCAPNPHSKAAMESAVRG